MTKVEAYMKAKIAAGKNNGCTLETAGVRREWYDSWLPWPPYWRTLDPLIRLIGAI